VLSKIDRDVKIALARAAAVKLIAEHVEQPFFYADVSQLIGVRDDDQDAQDIINDAVQEILETIREEK
jgi:hypothetical protein